MAVRTTMQTLIDRVRLLIYDPAGAGQVFSDQEIQDALDRHRETVRYLELTPAETYASGGAISYLDYYAPFSDWEEDAALYDSTYTKLETVEADYLTGHWVLTESTYPPVYLVGKRYDPYAAAADLLEAWAGHEKMSFDFNADGQAVQRSQKVRHLLELAQGYRRRQAPALARMVRADVV